MPVSPALTPGGGVWSTQVLPPSVVATMTASPAVESYPTAVQSDIDAQAMASSPLPPVGAVSLLQVLPPSEVVMMPFSPTAVQPEIDGQAMAARVK